MSNIDLRLGDCLELMRDIPDKSVDLVLTDPPYNIGVQTSVNRKKVTNDWDKIDNYIEWFITWINEAARILKPQGVLYFFHNDIEQIADLIIEIRLRTPLIFRSFCVWDKGKGYRAQSWHNREGGGLRCWFNTCEYCLHFFNTNPNETMWGVTGLERIYSNPECFKTLKQWYKNELNYLGLTTKDIAEQYARATGKKPYMLRHYFQNKQFELPTREVYKAVYKPLGFRKEYEELRKEYEELRNYHRNDPMHCNIWHVKNVNTNNRYHTCQKPVSMLQRLIRVSCPEGGVVFDPFMGSGSTGVAAKSLSRDFIGIELDPKYYEIAQRRMVDVQQPLFV